MNNLIIIGNGFDLAHNLKTRYNDFIDYIIQSQIIDKSTFQDLITIIQSIKSIDEFKKYLKNGHTGFMRTNNKFFGKLVEDIGLYNWCDIEKSYFDELTTSNLYKSVHEFHKDFDKIRSYLAEYLNTIDTKLSRSKSYQNLFTRLVNDDSVVLNFNYTDTLQNYSSQSHIVSNKNIINIHGKINNTSNPIIFGFAANDQESRSLINKNDKEYMRFIKKHCYKRTDNEHNLNFYLDNHKHINVFILGHSCGISDKLILNQIFNHTNINSIRIFYHENAENYFETQVNIDRIMNNDTNFKKLKSFQSSFKMPQINDNIDQENSFLEYIDSFIESLPKKSISNPRFF